MELREEDLLKIKQDLHGDEFKCGHCIDYPHPGIVCGQHGIACDPDEKACVLFVKSG